MESKSFKPEPSSSLAIVINDLRISHRSRVLNYGPSDRVDPVLFLLLRISDEVHRFSSRTQLKSVLFVQHIFSSLNSETRSNRDDATWLGGTSDGGLLEPEEFTLL
ncbi:hypothetical protein OWV82_007928 [Melia azedarach]|uniref:Uncharacterized protein n=1 Tax=Melia azedarach TaxID=155640 RepID=A0ACC1Y9B9_MELAZ|nr:hypothetical protein OWV82_007928 [Melia azedarach]